MFGVGETPPQTATVERIGAEGRLLPTVGCAGRARHALVVVQMDPVARDKVELVLTEVELPGLDRLSTRQGVGRVGVGGEAGTLVATRQLDAVDLALCVVKGGEDECVTELAFVLQVIHLAVVAVDAERDLRRKLMR